jgi:hypothetical protein
MNYLLTPTSLCIICGKVRSRHAEIDAFSQGKLPGKRLEMSARNMGKNDLWIAATAVVLDATLITTDHDFDHLAKNFVRLAKVKLVPPA